ncbi:MAG: hypothetical protein JWM80_3648 [Cyanobacteria bacterium RYN_339]|nr:hypothetical protein [Cyanobacteria bacterium RYN_339]
MKEFPFPRLELPEPPNWVAWNLGAAADRLDEPGFQVQMVRPLRGDKHLASPLALIMQALSDGKFATLGLMERKRAADDLGDFAGPAQQAAIAHQLWQQARTDTELQLHLLRRLARHLVGTEPIASALEAAFPAFAADPPGEVAEVCLMLDGLRESGADDSVGATLMREYLIQELGLAKP